MSKPRISIDNMEMIEIDSPSPIHYRSTRHYDDKPRIRSSKKSSSQNQQNSSRSCRMSFCVVLFIVLILVGFYLFGKRLFPAEQELIHTFQCYWRFILCFFIDCPVIQIPSATNSTINNQIQNSTTGRNSSIERRQPINFKYRSSIDGDLSSTTIKPTIPKLPKLLSKIPEFTLNSSVTLDRLCPNFVPPKQCHIDWDKIVEMLDDPKYHNLISSVTLNRFPNADYPNDTSKSFISFQLELNNDNLIEIESRWKSANEFQYSVIINKPELNDDDEEDEESDSSKMNDSIEYFPSLLIPLNCDKLLLLFLDDGSSLEKYCIIRLDIEQLNCSIQPIR